MNTRRFLVLMLLNCPAVCSVFAGAAEPSLRLAGIPDRLVLPQPEGANLVITAQISGAEATTVWLARNRDAKLKYSLTKTGAREYQANLADPAVAVALTAEGRGGQFQVFAELAGGQTLASLPVRYLEEPKPAKPPQPPKKLSFPGTAATLTVHQRRSRALPGSDDGLFLDLGDVTHGQVHVTVRDAAGKLLLDTVSMQQGESVPLKLAEEEYCLHLRELVNVLIGSDWATFDIARTTSEEWKKIEQLLVRIEISEAVFLREGKEYRGKEAAVHLRLKLAEAGPRIATLAEFIDRIASRSSVSGKPYEVRLPDGTIMPARAWLRDLSERPPEKAGEAKKQGKAP